MLKRNYPFFFVSLFVVALTAVYLYLIKSPTFYVEHARTKQQIGWGLMQRHYLPENQGMLFHYPQPEKMNFWSFNCYIALSVAFIDEDRVVRDIKSLYAYPSKMDPSRPVLSTKDFLKYYVSDPVVIFFQEKSVWAPVPVKYILEMNLGWFEKNHVKVGDILHWDDKSNTAYFIRN